jgi:hypothetical protein
MHVNANKQNMYPMNQLGGQQDINSLLQMQFKNANVAQNQNMDSMHGNYMQNNGQFSQAANKPHIDPSQEALKSFNP